MRYLVTGAAGFIGARLAAALRKNHDVTGCDPRPGPEVNRRGVASEECAEEFDVVFHCGGLIDIGTCEFNPLAAWEGNVVESIRLAQRATATRAFVYTTSYAALAPDTNIYGRVKAEADFWLSKMRMPYASVLLPNVYGEGGSGVISKFLFSKEPVLYGGDQIREFVYVDDVVQKLIEVGTTPQLGRHSIGGERISVAALADLLSREPRKVSARTYEVVKPPTFEPTWDAPTSLHDGIALTIKEAQAQGITVYGRLG